MKKNVVFAWGMLAALAFITTAGVFAQSAADFEVALTEDGNGVVITKYTGKVTNTIVIPATIEGMPVRVIGAGAFSRVGNGLFSSPENVTVVGFPFTVVLPPGLIEIRDRAFSYSALTSVVIPDSVTSIGDEAFSGCGYYEKTGFRPPRTDSLTSVTLPKGLTTVGKRAFAYNEALKTIVIPNGVPMISEGMFASCSVLTAITIPDSVASIGEKAFTSTGLTSITFGKGVASIGKEAFSSCRELKTIAIPEWITEIGENAFSGCSALTTVTIPESVESILLGGTNYSSGKTLIEGVFKECGKLNLATQARLKKITITTAYEVEQAQKKREEEERRAQVQREREEREAQAKRDQEERDAQMQRERDEREAQTKREREEREAQMQRDSAEREAQAKREQAAHEAEIAKIQRAEQTARALITRLTPIYNVAYSRNKPNKQQFNEFMSIYPDYIAAKNNYDSLSHGSWNWNPSYDSLDRSYRELESCVGMIMKVLDKNQQKQFDAKFK